MIGLSFQDSWWNLNWLREYALFNPYYEQYDGFKTASE